MKVFLDTNVVQVDVIVTRNIKDFKDFAENVQTPAEFLESILGRKSIM